MDWVDWLIYCDTNWHKILDKRVSQTYGIFKSTVYKQPYSLKMVMTEQVTQKLVIDLCAWISLQKMSVKLICRKCFPNNVDFDNWVYIWPKWAKITLNKNSVHVAVIFCECIFLVFENELMGGGTSRCLNIKFEASSTKVK